MVVVVVIVCLSIYLFACLSVCLSNCEISSIFELDNIKNETIRRFFFVDNIKNETMLRDFLQKWKVECRAGSLVPMCFCIFFPSICLNYCACREKSDARSYEVLHPSRQIILANILIWCSKMHPFLRKSAPWPPNISDEHVSCTPNLSVFYTFDFEMCFAPQRHALFRHRNFQKWSEHGVFCTFWLGNVLRASSRHNGVQFFISHLPSGLRTRRFSEPTFQPSGAPNH